MQSRLLAWAGEEHLCVEAGDVLLDVAAMDAPAAMASQMFKLRRSRERQDF